MSSSYRQSLEDWLKTVDVKSKSVLDIGGSQLPVSKRVKSWEVEEYKIMDLDDPHVKVGEVDIIYNINNLLFPPFQEGKYDTIFCLEVAEYLWNPFAALQNIHYFLKKGGKCYMSFPSVYPLHNPIEYDTLRYMPTGVKLMAKNANLKVTDIIYRRFESGVWLQLISTERLRAAKGEDINFSGFIMELTK